MDKLEELIHNDLQQYLLSVLEPDSQFEVRIENTILRGSDRCTFRITKQAGNVFRL